MFAYAIGSFFSGSLGDRLYPPMVVGVGLLGSAAMVLALVIGVNMDILGYSTAVGTVFFVGIWIVHGLMQSTGGPVNTAIMGGW
jgi:sugar phosphate permease